MEYQINNYGVRYRKAEYKKGEFCYILEYELTSQDKIVAIFKGNLQDVEELNVADLFQLEKYKILDI